MFYYRRVNILLLSDKNLNKTVIRGLKDSVSAQLNFATAYFHSKIRNRGPMMIFKPVFLSSTPMIINTATSNALYGDVLTKNGKFSYDLRKKYHSYNTEGVVTLNFFAGDKVFNGNAITKPGMAENCKERREVTVLSSINALNYLHSYYLLVHELAHTFSSYIFLLRYTKFS
jgi:hypothetical protein